MNDPSSGATVLIVDDEEYIRDLVSSAMRIAGFEVRSANDGHAALTAVSSQHPDLVILDVGLPGVDGLRGLSPDARRRRRHPGDLPHRP